jgi:hypothetical protein
MKFSTEIWEAFAAICTDASWGRTALLFLIPAALCVFAEAGAGEVLVKQRAIALAGDGFVAAVPEAYVLKGFREAVQAALVT